MKSPNKKPISKQQRFCPAGRVWSFKQRKDQARTVVDILRKAYPDAHCELYYRTPFQLLVSVVLSAQATDKGVNKAMQTLYDEGFEPKTVIEWGQEGLLTRIRTIGLAPTKSRNIYRLSQILLDEYGGEVPADRESLESLPGVGRKTASVILGELFQHPTLAVDTHVYRVTLRLGLQRENSPEKAENELLKVLDISDLPKAHHLFIIHGRYTCKAAGPLCESCPLAKLCPSYSAKLTLKSPRARKPSSSAPKGQSLEQGR